MNLDLTHLPSARSTTLDAFPWLTPSLRKRRKARLRNYGWAALMLGVLAIPQIAAITFQASPSAAARGASAAGPAAPHAPVINAPFAPTSLRNLSSTDAELWNAKVEANPLATRPALPFALTGQGTGFSRSLQCLTAAVYYEAGNEGNDGQRAVAQVVLNRMRHPEYPHSVCGVVFQGAERKTGCQFSFTCDGSLGRTPSRAGWQRAQGVAAAALAGSVYAPVGWATHYHADYVVPYWAQGLQKLTTIGQHIFYRWRGPSGEPGSFSSAFRVSEPEIAALQFPSTVQSADLTLPDETKSVTASERPIIAAGAEPASAPTSPPVPGPAASHQEPRPAPLSPERWIIAQPVR